MRAARLTSQSSPRDKARHPGAGRAGRPCSADGRRHWARTNLRSAGPGCRACGLGQRGLAGVGGCCGGSADQAVKGVRVSWSPPAATPRSLSTKARQRSPVDRLLSGLRRTRSSGSSRRQPARIPTQPAQSRLSKPYTQESDTSPLTMQSSRNVPSRTKPSFSSTRAEATLRVSVSD